jgi:hypothetical protein
MGDRIRERGQGLVEFAIMLPILLLLLIGVVEMGYLLRNYLVVVNADREACRYAARGLYSDHQIMQRAVSAGGVIRIEGQDVPTLRTHGSDPNAAVIVTRIDMNPDGDIVSYTNNYSGVITSSGGGVRFVNPITDSVVSLTQIIEHHGATTQRINDLRAAEDYESSDHKIVVVEVFFAHEPMFGNMLPRISFGLLPDAPWMMRADTEMRITVGRTGGGGGSP